MNLSPPGLTCRRDVVGRKNRIDRGGVAIKRRCRNCGAHTSIDGVAYCWKCREKLPTRSSAEVKWGSMIRGVSQLAVVLSMLGVVAVTFWWALQ